MTSQQQQRGCFFAVMERYGARSYLPSLQWAMAEVSPPRTARTQRRRVDGRRQRTRGPSRWGSWWCLPRWPLPLVLLCVRSNPREWRKEERWGWRRPTFGKGFFLVPPKGKAEEEGRGGLRCRCNGGRTGKDECCQEVAGHRLLALQSAGFLLGTHVVRPSLPLRRSLWTPGEADLHYSSAREEEEK